MGAKEEAKDLIAQRDKIDAEIEENFEILQRNGSTMDSPLIDKEGFPLSHIDVYSVRQARHNIICLRNDRKALTEKIEQAIQRSHAEMRGKEENRQDNECRETDGLPFTVRKDVAKVDEEDKKVTTVIANSPAAEGGLKADDLIIQYGELHADNFKDMKEVSSTTAKYEGGKLRVTVLRNNRAARLEVHPRRWVGNGILGCGIVPVSTRDII